LPRSAGFFLSQKNDFISQKNKKKIKEKAVPARFFPVLFILIEIKN